MSNGPGMGSNGQKKEERCRFATYGWDSFLRPGTKADLICPFEVFTADGLIVLRSVTK
jgi:hypothetical protein